MSTSAPDPNSGDAYDYFLTTGIPELARILTQAQRIAGERGLPSTRAAIIEVLNGVLADVNEVARRMAAYADEAIIAKIHETHTANRPVTGNMETHIASDPGPLGSVRVGLIDELDKIINPNGEKPYEPFWRAQEYGTGSDEGGFGGGGVPSQEGRVIRGLFEPSGTPPNSEQRGLNSGTDLVFLPGGENPGWGTISVELPGRHFLRDGDALAGARYVAEMEKVQQKWSTRIQEILAQLRTGLASSGSIKGIIKA